MWQTQLLYVIELEHERERERNLRRQLADAASGSARRPRWATRAIATLIELGRRGVALARATSERPRIPAHHV